MKSIVVLFTVLAGFCLTYAGFVVSSHDGDRVAGQLFEKQWDATLSENRDRLQRTFSLSYDALRTIAMLPGVQNIDRYARNFDGDPRLTVQQLYNCIASHVDVSEIYIVPIDLEPDQPDPVTGKNQEPITTFDHVIVGRRLDNETSEKSNLPEEEIFEYRQMKSQCAAFKEKYPDLSKINGMNWPAMISSEVITCDNTEFSVEQLASHNDAARVGFVYSLPFYDPTGKIKGLISAVIRTRVLARMMEAPYLQVSSASQSALIKSAVSGSTSADQGNFAYQKSMALEFKSQEPWNIQAAVPMAELLSTEMYQVRTTRGKMILAAGSLLTILSALTLWALLGTRDRAIALAQQMTAKLKDSEERSRVVVESAMDAVITLDEAGAITSWNPRASQVFGQTEAEVRGSVFAQLLALPHREGFVSALKQNQPGEENQALGKQVEISANRKDGSEFPAEITVSPLSISGRRAFSVFLRDITVRKEAERERDQAQKDLRAASRQAGMAEVAAGLLHNVGNVLNSINVSTTVLSDTLRASKVANVTKAAAILKDHQEDLGRFVTEDPKGKQIPGYIFQVGELLQKEQQTMANELGQLAKGIDHVKHIIQLQQSYAKQSTIREDVTPAELIEDALRMNLVSFDRHHVAVKKEFETVGLVPLDKHKTLQILVNLISNAKVALKRAEMKPGEQRLITVRLRQRLAGSKQHIIFEVSDNGIGIASDVLPRIFTHGFTTRSDGNGFGLHSSINAAREMGGKLTVASEGLGLGATFTLELPVSPAVPAGV